MNRFIAPLIIFTLALSGCTATGTPSPPAPQPPAAHPAPDQTKFKCQTIPEEDHVRTQYVAFANQTARYGYYRLGRSTSEILAGPALAALEAYFVDTALAKVHQLADPWPVHVDGPFPRTEVDSIIFQDDQCSTATLETRETWHIINTEDGRGAVLCSEENTPHVVTMRKFDKQFPAWKVIDISNFPAC